MARVPQGSWSQHRAYQFWNETEWTNIMPTYNYGERANIFTWSERINGVESGPGTGDLFVCPQYGCHILLFKADAPAVDANGKFAPYYVKAERVTDQFAHTVIPLIQHWHGPVQRLVYYPCYPHSATGHGRVQTMPSTHTATMTRAGGLLQSRDRGCRRQSRPVSIWLTFDFS